MKKLGSALKSYFHTTDKWLMLLWLCASGLSIVFLMGMYRAGQIATDREVRTMAVAVTLGLAAALVVSLLDYHMLLKLWKLYAPICVLLVALTFTSVATARAGNQAWLVFNLGEREFSIQPSEFLKLCFIMTFSLHLSKVQETLNKLPNVILLCLHGAAYALPIQMQGDSGSALIFVMIFLGMIFCAGLGLRYILAAAAALAVALPVLWMYILSDYQKMRILILQNPELDPDYAWQQNQALRAFVYGGMRGVGIFNDGYNYVDVPEAYNDLIFSFIGETCGFVGCVGVLLLLCAIAFKILYNSRVADDTGGGYICIGVFAMIVSQMIINIGMCIGLLPVIGVTLPLFSAGGTSVLTMYVGLGLVLSVYRHSKKKLFSN